MKQRKGSRWKITVLAASTALVAGVVVQTHFNFIQVMRTAFEASNATQSGLQNLGNGVPASTDRKVALAMFHSWIWNTPVRVDVFGGSIAAGWVDTKGGYINRALRAWAEQSHVHVALEQRAVPGMSIMQMGSRFSAVIRQTRPDWVILSWGGLDDAVAHTSVSAFRQAIRAEILAALAGGARFVWVVTPPVTAAAVINGPKFVPDLYFQAERALAASLHNPRVVVFPVFSQMSSWLQAHGQNYQAYEANGWHPNAKGHALAGQLLFQDMEFLFPPLQVKKELIVKKL